MKVTASYLGGVFRASFIEVWNGWGIWAKLADGLIILVAIGGLAATKNDPTALRAEFYVWGVLLGAALLLVPGLAILNVPRVAALRDKGQQAKLALKEYAEIEFSYSPLAETVEEKHASFQTRVPTENTRLAYLVSNKGGMRIRACRIAMVGLKLIDSPNHYSEDTTSLPVEDRPIKWKNHEDERIDISAGSWEPVILAEMPDSSPFGIFHFVVCGQQGASAKRVARVFEGSWEAIIQLEGQVEKGGAIVDLEPVRYTVGFEFLKHQLNALRVQKHAKPGVLNADRARSG